MTAASNLWGNLAELSQYDMVMLSCECDEHLENKGPAAYDAVNRYMAMGGRVYSSDFQYVWYKYSPDPNVRATAVINPQASPLTPDGTEVKLNRLAEGKGAGRLVRLPDPARCTVGHSRRCVQQFQQHRPPSRAGVGIVGAPDQATPPHPTFFSMNTPVGAPVEQQCGRAIHLDAHIVTSAP